MRHECVKAPDSSLKSHVFASLKLPNEFAAPLLEGSDVDATCSVGRGSDAMMDESTRLDEHVRDLKLKASRKQTFIKPWRGVAGSVFLSTRGIRRHILEAGVAMQCFSGRPCSKQLVVRSLTDCWPSLPKGLSMRRRPQIEQAETAQAITSRLHGS